MGHIFNQSTYEEVICVKFLVISIVVYEKRVCRKREDVARAGSSSRKPWIWPQTLLLRLSVLKSLLKLKEIHREILFKVRLPLSILGCAYAIITMSHIYSMCIKYPFMKMQFLTSCWIFFTVIFCCYMLTNCQRRFFTLLNWYPISMLHFTERLCTSGLSVTRQLTLSNAIQPRRFWILSRNCKSSLISQLMISNSSHCPMGKCWRIQRRWQNKRLKMMQRLH